MPKNIALIAAALIGGVLACYGAVAQEKCRNAQTVGCEWDPNYGWVTKGSVPKSSGAGSAGPAAAAGPTAPASSTASAVPDGGMVELAAVGISFRVPGDMTVTKVQSTSVDWIAKSPDSMHNFNQSLYFGTGGAPEACAQWEQRWRGKKFGTDSLPASHPRKFTSLGSALDSRWHATAVSDGMTVILACIDRPQGGWVQLEMPYDDRFLRKDLPAISGDIANSLYAGTPASP